MINISLLGSTGSIGKNTLDVLARSPEKFNVFAVSAQRSRAELLQQCLRFQPRYAVMANPEFAVGLQQELFQHGCQTELLIGDDALSQIAAHPEVDYVLAAIVGAAGLLPTLAAVRAGKRILLANKEALVMAGALFMQEVQQHKALLLPVDSEHNALFQAMPANYVTGNKPAGVKRLIITASGGPFRQTPLDQLSHVTPDQACAHPNWAMGRKISVDSATMMNKALEVIEAHWLFNIDPGAIAVLLHPQSIIHSLVEYRDGSVLAQLGNPDMRIPIAHVLGWPERIISGANSLDLLTIGQLDFAPLCSQRYPALGLAYQALQQGGTATAILNAANEVTVNAFLEQQVGFTDIVRINAQVLAAIPSVPTDSIATVLAADQQARRLATELIQPIANRTAA